MGLVGDPQALVAWARSSVPTLLPPRAVDILGAATDTHVAPPRAAATLGVDTPRAATGPRPSSQGVPSLLPPPYRGAGNTYRPPPASSPPGGQTSPAVPMAENASTPRLHQKKLKRTIKATTTTQDMAVVGIVVGLLFLALCCLCIFVLAAVVFVGQRKKAASRSKQDTYRKDSKASMHQGSLAIPVSPSETNVYCDPMADCTCENPPTKPLSQSYGFGSNPLVSPRQALAEVNAHQDGPGHPGLDVDPAHPGLPMFASPQENYGNYGMAHHSPYKQGLTGYLYD
eukprot:gene2245-biopygen2780